MKIYSVALNLHDQNTYDGVFHKQMERYTRFKHNIPYHVDAYEHHNEGDKLNVDDYRLNFDFVEEYFENHKDILAFSYTNGGIRHVKDSLFKGILKDHKEILDYKPKKLFDNYFKDGIYYIDHHQSHATYAFINSGYDKSDILAIDGIGAKYRCIFVDKDENITDLSKELPLGWIWNQMSKLTGFGPLGASKLMGLVAYGKYSDYYYNALQMILDDPRREKGNSSHSLLEIERFGKEDLAFTLQQFTLDKIKEHVYPLKTCENICLSGGVAYNGYMNEEFTKIYENVYVPPAIGDEGQAIGVYQHADWCLNKNRHIANVFAGKLHSDFIIIEDETLDITSIAQAIADGKIVGWYQGKSESGNRALGNRSILADPRNPNIKDTINHTIKKREDFRPFAPVVLEEHYKEYFETNQTSPFMSRIVKVKSDKVPGITHIDNTARIQTLNREFNPKLYDLINEFYKITGVPMLLNTSFNCREPIVETPEQAFKTYRKTDLDILVINNKVIRK
jgi:carbamoyltransferase|tara:strand:+ start:760 stop:2280 length:1521 start_codon:yes stop_codon:yes gene_type:complete